MLNVSWLQLNRWLLTFKCLYSWWWICCLCNVTSFSQVLCLTNIKAFARRTSNCIDYIGGFACHPWFNMPCFPVFELYWVSSAQIWGSTTSLFARFLNKCRSGKILANKSGYILTATIFDKLCSEGRWTYFKGEHIPIQWQKLQTDTRNCNRDENGEINDENATLVMGYLKKQLYARFLRSTEELKRKNLSVHLKDSWTIAFFDGTNPVGTWMNYINY